MARMVRKQIVIDRGREETLERLAAELELSQSEVIRQAIDDFAEKTGAQDRREQAWQRFLKVTERATDHGVTDEHGRFTWTREELHERGSG